MRDPESPDGAGGLKNKASATSHGAQLVSIPDRRRIDSDVRAFLREPSTPWIVFDQEGRPPSHLAVGEILSGPRKTLLSDYDFFAATAAADAAAAASHGVPAVEPSSLALASDLTPADASVSVSAVVADAVDLGARSGGLRRRAIGAAAAAVACLSVVAIGVMALGGASTSPSTATRSAGASVAATGAPASDPGATAPLTGVTAQGSRSVVATSPRAVVAVASPSPVVATAPAKKFGRLSIAGGARSKEVFFDGKRLLGHGARSFTVICGAHSIAVGTRGNAQDLDVPCNAELLLTK
jgi:hypothetical protein